MIVYADILILENTIVNLFLLTLTMKCVRHKYKMFKLISSALIGGIYTLILFLPKVKMLSSLPFALIIACIMLRLVYGKTSIANMAKLLGTFLMLTFTLSGICFLFSLKQNFYILGNTFKIEKYSIKYIMIGIMIIYIICNRIIEYIRERSFVNNYKYNIKFKIEDKVFELCGFLDTGNELREPITNLPCILIEEKLINSINFNSRNAYYIPYNSIGYGGNLKGIRVNNININGKGLFRKEIDAIICPCKEKLSKENEFNALLSRGIM